MRSPHVPTQAATIMATSVRASTTVRSMAAFLSCVQLTESGTGDPGGGGTVEAE